MAPERYIYVGRANKSRLINVIFSLSWFLTRFGYMWGRENERPEIERESRADNDNDDEDGDGDVDADAGSESTF